MTNEFIIVIIGISLLAIVIAILVYRWNHSTIYASCDWCNNEMVMYRKTWNWYLRTGTSMYCSGKCRREDEASLGVKEQRYRVLN